MLLATSGDSARMLREIMIIDMFTQGINPFNR
jgi:hypothetical protein